MFLPDLDWEGLSRIVPAASKRLRVWFSCGWKGNALALAVAFLTACGSSTPGGSNVSIRLDRTEITLAPGETQLFTATVTGSSNTAVSWTVLEGAAGGTTSIDGLYTAPSALGTYHVVATSQADNTKNAMATVNVDGPPIAVSIAPTMVNMGPSETQIFSASVTGTTNKEVSWSIGEYGGGSIDSTGVYVAPANEGTYHVVVVSRADSTKRATATVVVAGIFVTISPSTATVEPRQTYPFRAFVTGSTNTAVSWAVQEGVTGGGITDDGLYTAPDAFGIYHVVATSVADTSKSAIGSVYATLPAPIDVLTQHNDNARTGSTFESTLTVQNVRPGNFGLIRSLPVQGLVFAQPLFVTGIGGRNVVIVATAQNYVYAFDDATGVQVWGRQLGPPVLGADLPRPNQPYCTYGVAPYIGIIGTPVIDKDRGLLFLVTNNETPPNPTFSHSLIALRLSTGDLLGSIVIDTPGAQPPFDTTVQLQRAGLLLHGDSVYVAFGANGCDGDGSDNWHGWMMAYNTVSTSPDSVQFVQSGIFNSTPQGLGGGIWMSGAGPSVDDAGDIYIETGNGTYNAGTDFGDSFVKLHHDRVAGTLTAAAVSTVITSFSVSDGCIAHDQSFLMWTDLDLGTVSPLLLPPHHLVGGGKEGIFFILDRNAMGEITQSSQVVCAAHNTFWGPLNQGNDLSSYEGYGVTQNQNLWPHIHGAPAYWGNSLGGTVYVAAERDYPRAYSWSAQTATLSRSPFAVATRRARPNDFNSPGSNPTMPSGLLSVSGNPFTSDPPILWMVLPLEPQTTKDMSGMDKSDAILRAYDGTSLREIWNSGNVPRNSLAPNAPLTADFLGAVAKFSAPTIANGHVYVATFDNKVQVYGLKSSSPIRPLANGPDFDGDGQPDVVWRQRVSHTNLLWPLKPLVTGASNGNGPYACSQFNSCPYFDPELGDGWDIAATGDFDGDGQTDLVWRKDTGENKVWILSGYDPIQATAHWVHEATLQSNSDPLWRIIASGDFNGDGITDLVWRRDTGENSVWILGSYDIATNSIPVLDRATVVSQDPSVGWDLVGSGDWDLDGISDLVWRNRNTGYNSVWLMDPYDPTTHSVPVRLQTEIDIPRPPPWKIVGVADYNRDGRPDLLWSNVSTGENEIWIVEGPILGPYLPTLSFPLPPTPDQSWAIVGPK